MRPLDVAAALLKEAEKQGVPLTSLKAQFLLYYAHGMHLAILGGPLISSGFTAWRHGPTNSEVSEATPRHAGALPVGGDSGAITIDAKRAIQIACELYGSWTVPQLVVKLQGEHTPWCIAVSKNGSYGCPIEDSLIRDYFQSLVSKNNPPSV